jgi:hypothetical protein
MKSAVWKKIHSPFHTLIVTSGTFYHFLPAFQAFEPASTRRIGAAFWPS